MVQLPGLTFRQGNLHGPVSIAHETLATGELEMTVPRADGEGRIFYRFAYGVTAN